MFLDHLIQRRFFGAPPFVVDFASSRCGLNGLAHDRFLFLWPDVIYSIMVSPCRAMHPRRFPEAHPVAVRAALASQPPAQPEGSRPNRKAPSPG